MAQTSDKTMRQHDTLHEAIGSALALKRVQPDAQGPGRLRFALHLGDGGGGRCHLDAGPVDAAHGRTVPDRVDELLENLAAPATIPMARPGGTWPRAIWSAWQRL